MDAIPEPDPARANKHQPLPGDVPSPINPPLGSAFGHRIQYNIALECTNFLDKTAYDNYKLQKPGRAFFAKFRLFIN